MRDFRAQYQRERLHRAAYDGDLAEMRKLLERKYPVNRFDDLGRTPLHHAVERGHVFIVEELLTAGANVNAHDVRQIGNTPLNDSIQSCTFDMAKLLVDAGADPTLPGWMGLSALDNVQKRKGLDADRIRRLLQEAAKRQTK